jgi:hypothetical protein
MPRNPPLPSPALGTCPHCGTLCETPGGRARGTRSGCAAACVARRWRLGWRPRVGGLSRLRRSVGRARVGSAVGQARVRSAVGRRRVGSRGGAERVGSGVGRSQHREGLAAGSTARVGAGPGVLSVGSGVGEARHGGLGGEGRDVEEGGAVAEGDPAKQPPTAELVAGDVGGEAIEPGAPVSGSAGDRSWLASALRPV